MILLLALLAGTQGYLRTQVAGDRLAEVRLRIVDVLPQGGPGGGGWILFRLLDPLPEGIPGVAQGMRGSPVYVDEELVGAVSLGFSFTDPRLGGITPIEEMRRFLPAADAVPQSWVEVGLQPSPYGASLPFWVGVSPGSRVLRLLRRAFPGVRWQAIPGARGEPLPFREEPLRPGDALAYVLAHGVLPLYVLGTVSDVLEDGRFLAYGHPVLGAGSVSVPAGRARISWIADSLEAPFKIGYATSIGGVILEDRGPAIAGKWGLRPPSIPVEIEVVRGEKAETFREQIAPLEEFFPLATALSILAALERTHAKSGKGTAYYEFRVDAAPFGAVHWSDLAIQNYTLVSPNVPFALMSGDVLVSSVLDLYDFLSTVLTNPYETVVPRSISFRVRITPEDRSLLITDLRLRKPTPLRGWARYDPGDEIRATLQLQAYRGFPQRVELRLRLPEDLAPGYYFLIAYGGSRMPAPFAGQLEQDARDIMERYFALRRSLRKPRSAQDLVNAWLAKEQNTDLVLRLVPADFRLPPEEWLSPPPLPDLAAIRQMDGFVVGFQMVPIQIGEVEERRRVPLPIP